MRKLRIQYEGTEKRKRQIILAALACFNEMGLLNTTMEDIRARSGASNGSVYHHFKSKDKLAAAVYLEGIRDYQAGLLAELANNPPAREGIRAMVRYHLTWVSQRPELAKYLFRERHAEFMTDAEGAIAEANKIFAKEIGEYFRRNIEDGTLRSLSKELYLALILGPCQEFARHWLSRPIVIELERVIEEIAESAWRALRAREE